MARRVLIDARPLAGQTGVARYTRTLAEVLPTRDRQSDYRLFRWRSSEASSRGLPASVSARLPGRVLEKLAAVHLPAPRWGLGPFDVFHGTDYGTPFFSRVRTIATYHDAAYLTIKQTFPPGVAEGYDSYIRRHNRRQDLIVTHTEACRGELMAAYDIPPAKIRAFPPAVVGPSGLPLWAEGVAETAPVLGNKDYLLLVGGIGPRKNPLRVLRALHSLKQVVPHSLVITGNPNYRPGYMQSFMSEVDRLDMSSRVQLIGFVNDAQLLWLYRRAAALVFPSLYEGFGYPVIEAMSLGVPVITSNVATLLEVSGDMATYVDPLSEEEIAAALLDVCTRPGGRTAADDRKRYAAQFSETAFADRVTGLYRELCD